MPSIWERLFTKKPEASPSDGAKLAEALDQIASLSEKLQSLQASGTTDPVLIAQARELAEAFKNKAMVSNFQVAAAYSAVYARMSDSRRKMITEVDKTRNFYLANTLVSQIVSDALAPEVGTGNILEVKSDDPNLQKEIDYLEGKFDFDQIVMLIAPEILYYGDYKLETRVNRVGSVENGTQKTRPTEELINVTGGEAPKKPSATAAPGATEDHGLVELLDTVEQGAVVPLTKFTEITGYLYKDEAENKIIKKDVASYVTFSLGSQRSRIDLHKELGLDQSKNKQEFKDIPRFVRVGQSLIYPLIPKLRDLELLEAMVPGTKLAKLASGTVVGVQVPSGYDIGKAIDACKQIEGTLNKKVGVDEKLGELTVENIMATAGRIKAVPVFGDKGQLNKLDYQSDEPEELLASTRELREVICSSIGIPYEIIFGDDGGSKGQVLKKYARYLRLLRSIHKALEDGVRQIVYIHLANKGYKFTADDIKVEFFNKLIEIDNLDKLEFTDTVVGLLSNLKKFVFELKNEQDNPHFANRVDAAEFVEFLNKWLEMIGFGELIKDSPEEVTKPKTDVINITGTKPDSFIHKGGPQETPNVRDGGRNANAQVVTQ